MKVPIVPWHKVIWCSHYVPRWAIIEWIALQGRLPTKDKLHAWGVISDDGCDLCGLGQETHAHFFSVVHILLESGLIFSKQMILVGLGIAFLMR